MSAEVGEGQSLTRTMCADTGAAPGLIRAGESDGDLDLTWFLQALRAARGGDFSVRIPEHHGSQLAELAHLFNELLDRNERLSREIARVGMVIGREGRMTERLSLSEADAQWGRSVASLNALIDDLVRPTTEVARVISAVAEGDLTQKMALKIGGQAVRGEFLQIGTTVNTMVEQLRSFSVEVTRVAREVGTDGKLGGQATVPGVAGTWKDLTDSVNFMAANLTDQVRNIAQVTTAVARGDLSQKITVHVNGEILELKNTINTMVDQLSSFADEVTTVAREVGTEGKLGGQAEVAGVSGTWRSLTESVNFMAAHLTTQVRNIAQVTTAVAQGDLSQKITVEARGEILELKNTINTMVDQLSSFADEVTRVAREVGTEGKLGGQAEVAGVSGTWRDLTENVNQLAGNLTTQVRAIAEVSTAVTKGDLTRSIAVEAQGEVAELKDNINQMIANLRDTTTRSQEQGWLKTNLARISGLMQGERDLTAVSRLIMSELTPTVTAQHGAFFLLSPAQDGREPELRLLASYGYESRDGLPTSFAMGESLVGQAALERRTISVDDPPADYIRISSGLGSTGAASVLIMPVLFEDQLLGVLELAWLRPPSEIHRAFLEQLLEILGVVLNTIMANMRTEELLEKSQSLNAELEQQAMMLEERNLDIERKNREIEQARLGLEEKAAQLAQSGRYKSEFLANMSHELRTPLNSLLILSKLLLENESGNLSERQLEFARTIGAAGSDLLELINDILDLSKIEAGKIDLRPRRVWVSELSSYVRSTFEFLAVDKGLTLDVIVDADVPAQIVTDQQRLQQILRNLLSNAVKFTTHGGVALRIARAGADAISFAVTDTGIGIPADKLSLIFEAFHQGDGTTSRTYGGTGLGLSISRELALALGGELTVSSEPGVGSTFVLTLRRDPAAEAAAEAADDQMAAELLEPELLELLGSVARAESLRRWPAILRSVAAPTGAGPLAGTDGQSEPAARLSGRILLVDDDVRNLFALASLLEDRGLEVVCAENGQSALDMLDTDSDIDLVLMDIMMPEMDGYETIRAVRTRPQLDSLPIIAVTAKAMQGDRVKSIAAGASDYITKPVDPDRLVELVRGWLDG